MERWDLPDSSKYPWKCWTLIRFNESIIDAKGEEDWRQVEQVRTLVKTIYLFTSVKVIIFIITNDQNFYAEILESFKSWEVEIQDKIR